MYETLKKMKSRIGRGISQKAWLKMVEQAKEHEKLTEEEYEMLMEEE